MNYPFWDAPVGYGVLMAVIAVFHVFVSHFAIGGGLYLVVVEQAARKRGDQAMLGFLEKLSTFFVLTTLVAGALTGVGIWFIIGLLSPTATEALIHNYVWGWATEWTFFVVEIAAAILYYYGWKRMAAREHVLVGWIYFVAAWLSLFVINGILTFMLTPGRWLATGGFWAGFFNPTFWPSLVMRTGVCVMLAGLYASLVASRYPSGELKARLVRGTATWGLAGLAVTAASQYWYWKAVPAEITRKALEVMPTTVHALRADLGLAALLGALLLLALTLGRRWPVTLGVTTMAAGLAWFGAFEMTRESIRKPYILSGYVYANSVEVAKTDRYERDGYLSQVVYRTGDDGADLFRHACRSCHTLDGYKALKPAFDGTDRAFIAAIVRSAHLVRGNMPPFLGTAAEADEIAAYLDARIDHRPIDEGARAYRVRCGKCHVVGAASDKSASLAGQSAEELSGLLDMAANLGEGMPDYTGGPGERAVLVAYMQALGRQVKP